MTDKSPPNILIITTDQQRTDSVGCYGSPWMRTPHHDRLASEGICFERAYCTNPVCMPSRVSLFGGKMVSRHGVWNVGVNTPTDERLVSDRLAAAGYSIHYIGKAHFQAFGGTARQSLESMEEWQKIYPGIPTPYYGFQTAELALGHSYWGMAGDYGAWVRDQVGQAEFTEFQQARRRSESEFGGEACDWAMPLRFHNSVWTADRTVDFLQRRDETQPFLLAVGFEDPHHPHALPLDFEDRVAPESVPLPDFTEGELDDKPQHFLEARHGLLEKSASRGEYPFAGQHYGADFSKVAPGDALLGRAYYYGMVQLIDAQLGRILDALDRTGLAENTLIVFTSDHGELLGDHGLWMKGPFHYEQLIRVPLLMRWPRGLPPGTRTSALWSHTDLVPTLLDAAGVAGDGDLDGISCLPGLRGEAAKGRDSALIECIDDPRGLRLKTLVTANRKLTWYCGEHQGELYDLDADPAERINRWNDPAYAADKSNLLGQILTALEPLEARAPRHCYA